MKKCIKHQNTTTHLLAFQTQIANKTTYKAPKQTKIQIITAWQKNSGCCYKAEELRHHNKIQRNGGKKEWFTLFHPE
ncbi:hypothetical protein VIGAN_04046300 [Vigna angularis var. angularis]|uniref:Uncharacterized protein n=1 Tax=Vigna angularis var. angularis TaxID=157739 RepID=A0A0S3RRU2_PHAAN|nr:hypothetical protein VIGAN_04046300 [Vigna angularis var. angularis]